MRVARPKPMPAVQPQTALTVSDGNGLAFATDPARARHLLEEIRFFLAAAEPWRPYDPKVKQHSECRCGASTNAPGPRGWKWRKITGPSYRALKAVLGHGRRTESLCPGCQATYGV